MAGKCLKGRVAGTGLRQFGYGLMPQIMESEPLGPDSLGEFAPRGSPGFLVMSEIELPCYPRSKTTAVSPAM